MRLSHVFHLGIKEFYSLLRDPVMLFLFLCIYNLYLHKDDCYT